MWTLCPWATAGRQSPFKMRIQDGWLLGRGVSDDKGPMIVTLYALKFLKEQGYQLRYPSVPLWATTRRPT